MPPHGEGVLSPFDLNLRHLRGLLAVCDLGSISGAAEALSYSQPALTQGIVKLEALLGQSLFERLPHGMAPTAAGRVLAERVRVAFEHLDVGIQWLKLPPEFQPDRRLSMTQLRAFLALADAGGFGSAAQAVGLSQTAVHRAVRDLEENLERRLVERRGRGVSINFLGKRFARSCRLACHEIEAAFFELGIDTSRNAITLGTTPLARPSLVPEAMARMVAGEPSASIQVFEGSWGELVELLRDGLIDLIVGELPPHESPDLVKTALYYESLVIVAGRQHPLAGVPAPSLETLATYPWIIGPDSSPLRSEWERLFASGRRPAAPVECGSIMIVGRLLTSSQLLTLATPGQVALQIRSGLLARIGEPLQARRHTIGLTVRHNWRPTAVQKRFLLRLQEAVADVGATPLAVEWNTVGASPVAGGSRAAL
ncbi:MAG: LysR family transcriptional regulator [Pigmentiphaga sp.]|nr:LysR family transcriptional regulator [Pigmentiphaga sp.]